MSERTNPALILFWFFVLSSPTHAVDQELRLLLKEAVADTASFPQRYDAEVWLVDMSGRLRRWVKDPVERTEILRSVL